MAEFPKFKNYNEEIAKYVVMESDKQKGLPAFLGIKLVEFGPGTLKAQIQVRDEFLIQIMRAIVHNDSPAPHFSVFRCIATGFNADSDVNPLTIGRPHASLPVKSLFRRFSMTPVLSYCMLI
jgi:hypothetical protein